MFDIDISYRGTDTCNPIPDCNKCTVMNTREPQHLHGYYFEEIRDILYGLYVKDGDVEHQEESSIMYHRLYAIGYYGGKIEIKVKDLSCKVVAAHNNIVTKGRILKGYKNGIDLSPVTISSVTKHIPMETYVIYDNMENEVHVNMNTYILTYSGFRKVKDLLVGNLLFYLEKFATKPTYTQIVEIRPIGNCGTRIVKLHEPNHHLVISGFIFY